MFKSNLQYNNCKFQLYDLRGRKISSYQNIDSNIIFSENIKRGIYTYAIYQNEAIIFKGKVFVKPEIENFRL